jgi:hypothetical protein
MCPCSPAVRRTVTALHRVTSRAIRCISGLSAKVRELQLTASRLSTVILVATAPPPEQLERDAHHEDAPPDLPLPLPPGTVEVRVECHHSLSRIIVAVTINAEILCRKPLLQHRRHNALLRSCAPQRRPTSCSRCRSPPPPPPPPPTSSHLLPPPPSASRRMS